MPAIMFVCLGNICRSPAAEAMLRHLAANHSSIKNLKISSCGLGSWHIGQLPDLRMQETAKRRGVTLSSKAQQLKPEFFEKYDYILAADHEILNTLYKYATTPEQKNKLHLITAFSSSYNGEDLPDPYYGGEAHFELVLDMIEDACEGLLQYIEQHH